jgi:hypothetical protein
LGHSYGEEKVKARISLLLVALLLAVTVAAVAAAPGVQENEALLDLAMVRKATVKYHDVNQAIADGYVAIPGCVEVPGVGAMGVHYLKESLLGDMTADLTMPEVLLYIPFGDGLRLVGVEYLVIAFADVGGNPIPWFDHEPPDAWYNPAPELFGHTFHGPMEGHDGGMPWHYDFHVWAWQANPAGIFADFNPMLSCG